MQVVARHAWQAAGVHLPLPLVQQVVLRMSS